ncbi:MAG TPA: hypothetical protein VK783_13680 [Bacteroidia bacterium]|jgi:hypothetical protein|nr:hypothetical protein [Bacteroidia bacterium]
MATYLVRIVLHQVDIKSHPDYVTLHQRMRLAHFSTQIQAATGIWYHLPPAEYIINTVETIVQVHDKAKKIADSVDPDNGVLVVEAPHQRFSGLLPV